MTAANSTRTVTATPTATETSQGRKRKNPNPHRSIPKPASDTDRQAQGIFTLDVYSIFRRDPKSLLYRSRKQDKPTESDASSSSSTPSISKRQKFPAINLAQYTDTAGAIPVVWKKGTQLEIPPSAPGYFLITPEELRTCSTLRMLPDQYLTVKETLLSAAQGGMFKKREAKSWFRIDVNKTAILYDWFRSLGWIPQDAEWAARTNSRTQKTTTTATTTATTYDDDASSPEKSIPVKKRKLDGM
ncbi:Transcriptional adapter ada2 [Borealophlyctis nickersoniae]|nr:Transcriptional adapter ada2 [Borealophlyctis nickersoniae]